MKAYDITKLIAELKSDSVQYRNKISVDEISEIMSFLY